MAERKSVQLRFDGGIDREFDTGIPGQEGGGARELTDWQPTPHGGLRSRRQWLEGIALPAGTYDPKSGGIFPVQAGTMTPYMRRPSVPEWLGRSAIRKMKRGLTVIDIENEWPRPTMQGSLLLAVLVISHPSIGTSTLTVTPKSGWSVVGAIHSNDSPTTVSMHIFKIENAAPRSGVEWFIWSLSVRRVTLDLMEFRGVENASLAQDVFKSAAGFSVLPATGLSVPTDAAAPKQLVVGAIAGKTFDDSIKADEFPPGWEAVERGSVGWGNYWLDVVTSRKIIMQSGAQEFRGKYDPTQDEDDAKSRWVAALVSFRAKPRTRLTGDYLVTDFKRDASNERDLRALNLTEMLKGTNPAWSDLGSAGNVGFTEPLALAPGAGVLLATGRDLVNLHQWDGEALSSIPEAPAARALTFHKGRFFAASTKKYPQRLYWSAIEDATSWDETKDWIDVGEDGSEILDIANVQDGLLIAKPSSLHFLVTSGETFELVPLAAGTAMSRKSICPIPGGAVIGGPKEIWGWQGGAPELISQPLDGLWDAVAYRDKPVVSEYLNGLVYMGRRESDRVFVYDTERDVWWMETVPFTYTDLVCWNDAVLFAIRGPAGVNQPNILRYLLNPTGLRNRDPNNGNQVFELLTPELMLDSPARPVTPLWLWIAYQKRNYGAGHPALEITPYYDGQAQPVRSIAEAHPRGGQTIADGDHRIRLDVGAKGRSACHKAQFRFRYAPGLNATQFDIEHVELVFDVEEPR